MQELKTMNSQRLFKQLASLREQLRQLRFKIYTKEVKNNHQLRKIKKDIARILTVININKQ
ncbi:MAG: 50S ribosomal protein L29 [Candidatus Doudnabacteria bacterium]|nr:50S ribosomal protein L29 [Candidatus Doudnabacteria bacterium]